MKATLTLSVGDGDGGAFTRNMGKEVHHEISVEYVECFFYILAKHWKCPEAFGNVGLWFMRDGSARHILNMGVDNNTNR